MYTKKERDGAMFRKKNLAKSVTLGQAFSTPMPMPFRDDGLPDWDAPTLGSFVSFTLENGPLKGRVVVLKRQQNGMYVIAEDDNHAKNAANRELDKEKLHKDDFDPHFMSQNPNEATQDDLHQIQELAESTMVSKAMRKSRRCPVCGTMVRYGARRCPDCGKSFLFSKSSVNKGALFLQVTATPQVAPQTGGQEGSRRRHPAKFSERGKKQSAAQKSSQGDRAMSTYAKGGRRVPEGFEQRRRAERPSEREERVRRLKREVESGEYARGLDDRRIAQAILTSGDKNEDRQKSLRYDRNLMFPVKKSAQAYRPSISDRINEERLQSRALFAKSYEHMLEMERVAHMGSGLTNQQIEDLLLENIGIAPVYRPTKPMQKGKKSQYQPFLGGRGFEGPAGGWRENPLDEQEEDADPEIQGYEARFNAAEDARLNAAAADHRPQHVYTAPSSPSAPSRNARLANFREEKYLRQMNPPPPGAVSEARRIALNSVAGAPWATPRQQQIAQKQLNRIGQNVTDPYEKISADAAQKMENVQRSYRKFMKNLKKSS